MELCRVFKLIAVYRVFTILLSLEVLVIINGTLLSNNILQLSSAIRYLIIMGETPRKTLYDV